MRWIIAVSLAAVLAFAAVAAFAYAYAYPLYSAAPSPVRGGYGYGYGYGPYGMMGGYGYGYGPTSAAGSGQVGISQAISESSSPPPYVEVFPSNDSIAVDSAQANLVVLAMMGGDAVNMTHQQLPAYAHGDVFVIYGLIDPTIVLRPGASLTITLVNLDDDMYHNLVFSAQGPPYPYNAMPLMMGSGMVPYLPPANYGEGTAYSYTFSAHFSYPGTYWYLCTYPGHAQDGMYGEVLVE